MGAATVKNKQWKANDKKFVDDMKKICIKACY
jgi:hypothetical protein